MIKIDEKALANTIDHTLLDPAATDSQIKQLCKDAVDYGFYSACMTPRWVKLAAAELENTETKVCSIVSFPLGCDSTEIKAAQAKDIIFAGADEVDMVADLAAIIQHDERYLVDQFNAVLKVCHSMRPAVTLKVIIEATVLNKEQKEFVCRILENCGVDFIKSSTGYNPAGGATVEDIKLIKETSLRCKVKASGGIKTAKQAIAMLQAGADRIGTSSGIQIINEFRAGQIQ